MQPELNCKIKAEPKLDISHHKMKPTVLGRGYM